MAARWRVCAGLWVLLFLICCGLGFPTLGRYDTRTVSGTNDSGTYLAMVESGPPYPAGEDYNRVLLPLAGRPIYLLARDNVGSWDAAALALLVVNSGMVATGALLLFSLGGALTNDPSVGIVAALLLLLNFTTPNVYLAGVVDAGELCGLMAVTSALWFRRWWWLPIIGVLGVAAKDTFLVSSVLLAGGWVIVGRRVAPERSLAAIWTAAMAVVGLATMVVLLSWNRGRLSWPWNLATEMAGRRKPSNAGVVRGAIDVIVNPAVLYTFGWLLPLGIWRLGRLPRQWLIGTGLAVAGVLAMAAYGDARDNAGRVLFLVAGPPLCLSAALLLTDALARLHGGLVDSRVAPRR